MKFLLVDTQEFDWPVKPKQPSQSKGGKFETITIMCRFRMLPEDREKELDAEFEALTTEEEKDAHRHDKLREVLLGWDETAMAGADGKPVPFTEEMRDRAISMPSFRLAAYQAYTDAITGGALRGN